MRRIRNWFRQHEIGTVVSALVVLVLVAFFWPYFVTIVPAGSAGVIWSRISQTRSYVVAGEGLHVVPPWQIVTIYDLRYQTIESEFTVLAKDGLDVQRARHTRYRPSERELTTCTRKSAPSTAHTIVEPEVGTAVRVVAGQFEPEQFYSAGLMQMQERVIEVARERVRTRYVDVDDVFIRNIVMPKIVSEAIQRKIQQEQAALTMLHLLERRAAGSRSQAHRGRGHPGFSSDDFYRADEPIPALQRHRGHPGARELHQREDRRRWIRRQWSADYLQRRFDGAGRRTAGCAGAVRTGGGDASGECHAECHNAAQAAAIAPC